MKRNFQRDCEIFAAFDAGEGLENIAGTYGMTAKRVQAIVIAERHRRAISPEPFYQSLRRSSPKMHAGALGRRGNASPTLI